MDATDPTLLPLAPPLPLPLPLPLLAPLPLPGATAGLSLLLFEFMRRWVPIQTRIRCDRSIRHHCCLSVRVCA